MRNILLAFVTCIFSLNAIAQSPITFTLVTAPCDSDGVLVAHYSASSFPVQVCWGYTGGVHTTSSLNDTLYHYRGEWIYLMVRDATTYTTLDTGTYPGHLPFTFTFTGTPAHGTAFGTASVTVTGGTPPYSIRWYEVPYGWPTFIGTGSTISDSARRVLGVDIIDGAGCWINSGYAGTDSWAHNCCDTIQQAGTSSVRGQLKDNKLTITPNPVTTALTVSASGETINRINIINLLGQTVHDQLYNSEQAHIDVADLPAGIYYIRVNEAYVQRFLKE